MTKEIVINDDVVVVIGAGGIGLAIARRQGAGRSVLLADFNEDTLSNDRQVQVTPSVDLRNLPFVQILTRATATTQRAQVP